jgi:hypothetical protein
MAGAVSNDRLGFITEDDLITEEADFGRVEFLRPLAKQDLGFGVKDANFALLDDHHLDALRICSEEAEGLVIVPG